ncbi:hypothetical protein [Pendulispora albinea]|uniref:CopG family transcriptional regulator n=1 Tax=Pendulispora albinea TaxID=2741071 RepID=A0ABZ2LRI4_9BACT
MPRARSENAIQITLRVEPEWLPRADAVARELGRPGFFVTRTSVIRMAMVQGLEQLERTAGVTDEEPAPEILPAPAEIARDP